MENKITEITHHATKEELRKLIKDVLVVNPLKKSEEIPKDRWHQIPVVKLVKEGSNKEETK